MIIAENTIAGMGYRRQSTSQSLSFRHFVYCLMFRLPPILFLIPSCSLLPFPQPLRSDLSSLRRTHFRHWPTVQGPRHLLLTAKTQCCLSFLQVTQEYDWLKTRSKNENTGRWRKRTSAHGNSTPIRSPDISTFHPSGPILCILIGSVARRAFLWGPVNCSVPMRFLVCFSTGGRISIHPPYRFTQPFLVVGLDFSMSFSSSSSHLCRISFPRRKTHMSDDGGSELEILLHDRCLINSIHSTQPKQGILCREVFRCFPVRGFLF